MKVDIWSDVICPFCYIGKRRLEKVAAEEGVPLEVNWHSFELDPNSPAVIPGTLPEMVAKKYGMTPQQGVQSQQQIAAAAAQDGIRFNWEKAKPGNTFNAHRVMHLAKEHGLGDKAEEAFFKAYMTDGEAIGDPATVERIGIELGLPPAEVRDVLDSNRYADAVRQDEAIAHRELNVSGVPFFVFDNNLAVSGAQPEEVFRDILRKAKAQSQGQTAS